MERTRWLKNTEDGSINWQERMNEHRASTRARCCDIKRIKRETGSDCINNIITVGRSMYTVKNKIYIYIYKTITHFFKCISSIFCYGWKVTCNKVQSILIAKRCTRRTTL